MFKNAYPNNIVGNPMQPSYDVHKWVKTLEKIYLLSQQSQNWNQSFKQITAGWDPVELQDFISWMKFYNEGGHMAYKTAQFAPGFVVPTKVGPPNLEAPSVDDIVAKKIKAIIGRLNAAERLASDPDVKKELQKTLDMGLNKWFEELHHLKRMIQTSNVRYASTINDFIFKSATKLAQQGFKKAAVEMAKFAQDPAAMPIAGALPGMTPPPVDPNVTAPQPENVGDDGTSAVDEFIKGLNFEDENDIQDPEDDPLSEMTIIAQEIEVPQQQAMPQAVPQTEMAPIQEETVEQPVLEGTPVVVSEEADDLIDAALSRISLKDVILELDGLVNFFRTREIPRKLAKIDLMLDALNLSSFFPTLGEASNKILESNQYVLTRIEDILSKLKGSITLPNEIEVETDATGEIGELPETISPEVVRQQLQQQNQEEKEQKEARKNLQRQQERQQVENIQQDLAQPTQVVTPPSNPNIPPTA